MKLFLAGASGLVGSALARAASRRGHEVIGVVGKFAGELPGFAQRLVLDLTDDAATTRAVLAVSPDAIVNCAAISEPAVCEANPARAEATNVKLPTVLARLARRLGARIVHVSSEQVFDGSRRTPYSTGDATGPINLYGRQKVLSEQAVLTDAPEYSAIVRAPLLMGNSPGGRRGVHERLLCDWATAREVCLYTDEFRQPCSAENLAEVLVELAERRDLCGVFHWAGTDLISRFELGHRIRRHFKLSEVQASITAVTRADMPAAARERQACLALDLAPLAGRVKTAPQSIDEQLATLKIPRPCQDWYLNL